MSDACGLELHAGNVAVIEVLVEHKRADEDHKEHEDREHDAVPRDRVGAADRVDQVTVIVECTSLRVL